MAAANAVATISERKIELNFDFIGLALVCYFGTCNQTQSGTGRCKCDDYAGEMFHKASKIFSVFALVRVKLAEA